MNLQDQVTKAIIKPEKEMASVDWESVERVKPPWVPIKHGKTVPPLVDQKNPQPLTNEMVLQRRDEPIGNSSAPPISGRDKGMVETTRSKQTQSGFGVSGI